MYKVHIINYYILLNMKCVIITLHQLLHSEVVFAFVFRSLKLDDLYHYFKTHDTVSTPDFKGLIYV